MSKEKPIVHLLSPIHHFEFGYQMALEQLHIPRPGGKSPHIDGALYKFQLPDQHQIDKSRTILTHIAMQTDADYLFWVDDDMTFPPDSLLRLLKHDVDIVGGLCFTRRPPYAPVLARKVPGSMASQGYAWVWRYPPNELIEVDFTGAAFLLVKRQVYETLIAKHGIENIWSKYQECSEDFSFCLRARESGYKVHVDTGCKIDHWGKVPINEEFSRKHNDKLWGLWEPDVYQPKEKLGQPVASVVIVTYNQKWDYVEAAVKSALNQTVPVEVIVVDNGTVNYAITQSDGTFSEVLGDASKLPETRKPLPEGATVIRVAENPGLYNGPLAKALNHAISRMTTNWFVWLGSDDLFTTNKVEVQLSDLIQRNKKCGYHLYNNIGTDNNLANAQQGLTGRWDTIQQQKAQLWNCCVINGSTVMIHKDVFKDIGKFDESFVYSMDYEMWLRIGQKYFWSLTDYPLGSRRNDLSTSVSVQANSDDTERKLWRNEDTQIREMYPVICCEACRRPL